MKERGNAERLLHEVAFRSDWERTGIGDGPQATAEPPKVPFAEFESVNNCLMREDGCEEIEWMREQFGDPVAITQDFIRHAYLHCRGIGFCALLDRHVPEHLRSEHAAFVKEAKGVYRDAVRQAEGELIRSGDVAAYDQAIAIAFLRHRGLRFGALEGAFTPAFLPYY